MSRFQTSSIFFKSLGYKNTVLIDPRNGKPYQEGQKKPLLEYLMLFLDGYDFGKQIVGEFTQKTQTVIDPAVLGLLFEKLNGYKDGSYYTPSFITEFMANEAIELGIVQKANEKFGMKKEEEFSSLEDVTNFVGYDKEKRSQLNQLINSFTVCDPSVGSGHFLVSCLNKLLEIKYKCRLIEFNNGKILRKLCTNRELPNIHSLRCECLGFLTSFVSL